MNSGSAGAQPTGPRRGITRICCEAVGRARPQAKAGRSAGRAGFPAGTRLPLGWFEVLSAGLAVNGMAPPVVTWIDIEAWRSAMGVGEVEPWEAATLVQLGMLRASVLAEKANK